MTKRAQHDQEKTGKEEGAGRRRGGKIDEAKKK
jgi:hypothetical protein